MHSGISTNNYFVKSSSLFQDGGKMHIKMLKSNFIFILTGYPFFAKNESCRNVTCLRYLYIFIFPSPWGNGLSGWLKTEHDSELLRTRCSVLTKVTVRSWGSNPWRSVWHRFEVDALADWAGTLINISTSLVYLGLLDQLNKAGDLWLLRSVNVYNRGELQYCLPEIRPAAINYDENHFTYTVCCAETIQY